ncbi:MAG: AMP-binding protein [Pseudomonadota bacterium]|nr:AMP-binding protein [Pseudomonadota bacterium]
MLNLSRIVAYNAQTRPEADALIYNDERLNWTALNDRVLTTAAGLGARGIGPDSIVALVMKNSAAFVELLYALSHLGAVALPVNFRLTPDEVSYIVGHAGAVLVIADDELAPLAAKVAAPVLLLDEAAQKNSTALFDAAAPAPSPCVRSGGDLFRLMYTSGTTDRPKGVIHSYDNFYWKCFDHIIVLGLSAEDRLCVAGPLYHVGACDLPGLAVHLAGGAIVVLREFDADAVMTAIEAERITGIWLAPVMTNAILGLRDVRRYDCKSLKWCIGGGERTPESRIREFLDVFPNARYIDAYGMTETVSGDTFMVRGFEISKIGSVGRPTPMLELEIRDDAGAALPPTSAGEVCMRGPKVTAGYWKDPQRTSEAMWPDGFLRSGDVGYLDEDGFLFLTDRKKDMIISGGENISSSEVERVLYEMPEVKEAAVVARPDERWGETPVAVIVLQPDAKLTYQQLNAFCRARLAGFKCPRDLVLTDSLPRNPSGKILKRVLRDMI